MSREVSSVLESASHSSLEHERDTSSSESALISFLYPTPAKRSVGAIFKWWERRRLAYNAVVGAGGVATIGIAAVVSQLLGFPMTLGDLLAPVIPIGIIANLCYTLGPLTESFLHKIWGRDVLATGPHLFRAGLILSLGATFVFPTLLMGLGLVAWLFRALFGLM